MRVSGGTADRPEEGPGRRSICRALTTTAATAGEQVDGQQDHASEWGDPLHVHENPPSGSSHRSHGQALVGVEYGGTCDRPHRTASTILSRNIVAQPSCAGSRRREPVGIPDPGESLRRGIATPRAGGDPKGRLLHPVGSAHDHPRRSSHQTDPIRTARSGPGSPSGGQSSLVATLLRK
jgi:hypothetical protein